jgi:hypothetical protein
VGDGDPDADKYMEKMLPTKVGRGLFPSTAACIGAADHLIELGKNCASALKTTGKHLHQALGFFLVGGLPTSFASKTLNVTASAIHNFRKQPGPAAMTTMHWNYAPDPNTISFTGEEETVMRDFFFATTSVMSGAVRTTRNLEKSEHEWEEEMYAIWPSMLRKAVEMNPELVKSKKSLTAKKKAEGTPHGMVVLCVVVHKLIGPSSVHIT